ncbi:MAG: matrixin family metalloprotease [Labilithrix sp.]|nr:matrixin family metalloprotease [Labilithrix sp.]
MTPRTFYVAACAAALTCVPFGAGAFEVKRSSGGQLVRWPSASVSWTLDDSMVALSAPEDALAAALGAWSDREGAPSLSIVSESAPLVPRADGVNGVFYAAEGLAGLVEKGSRNEDALALTIVSFDERTGAIVDTDIVINGTYRFSSKSALAPAAAQGADDDGYDLSRVLAHEVGHALGLRDEPAIPEALMYPVLQRVRRAGVEPSADDLRGLRALYASGASSSSRDDRSSGCAIGASPSWERGALVAVALVAIVLARRSRQEKDSSASSGASPMLASASTASRS